MSARPGATIPIRSEAAAAAGASAHDAGGCGACHHGPGAAACQPDAGDECPAARLTGPEHELRRLLAALGRRLGFEPQSPETGGVRSLRVADGEVELQLAHAQPCQAAERAETAFDTLRSLLPDTDIFVTAA